MLVVFQWRVPARGRRGGAARGRGRGRGRIAAPAAPAASAARAAAAADWVRIDGNDDHVPAHDFIVRSTGPRLLPARNSPPIAYFLLLFTVGTLRTVLTNTLAYATKLLDDLADVIQRHPSSRMRRWSVTDLTMVNLKRYLGLCINTGLIKKKNVKDYWSRKNPSQYTPFFASVMSYRLFSFIQRVLHVGPIDAPARGQPNFDPWSKVRPVLDTINATFKTHFTPPQHVSIDESMVGMKNRVVFLQYMPNKRHSRFGIKKFELCDAVSGYVLHVEMYAGKDFTVRGDMGQPHAVVMQLMRQANLLDKGYHLFTDNFYTRPALARELSDAGTLLTGTVRSNTRGLPLLPARLEIGECVSFRNDDILVVAWREKKSQRKPVLLLSTSESAGMTEVRTGAGVLKQKPKCVAAYNKFMGGVDLSDRMIYHLSAERPSKRYWKKIFFNFLDMALLNSYVLYCSNTDAAQRKSRHDFVASVVESLCAAGDAVVPAMPPAGPACRAHELQHLPGRQERDCVVCSDRSRGIRKRSSYCCTGCDDGVHRGCFHQMVHKRPHLGT